MGVYGPDAGELENLVELLTLIKKIPSHERIKIVMLMLEVMSARDESPPAPGKKGAPLGESSG